MSKYRNIHTGHVQEWTRDGNDMIPERGIKWVIGGYPTGFFECHELVVEPEDHEALEFEYSSLLPGCEQELQSLIDFAMATGHDWHGKDRPGLELLRTWHQNLAPGAVTGAGGEMG